MGRGVVLESCVQKFFETQWISDGVEVNQIKILLLHLYNSKGSRYIISSYLVYNLIIWSKNIYHLHFLAHPPPLTSQRLIWHGNMIYTVLSNFCLNLSYLAKQCNNYLSYYMMMMPWSRRVSHSFMINVIQGLILIESFAETTHHFVQPKEVVNGTKALFNPLSKTFTSKRGNKHSEY